MRYMLLIYTREADPVPEGAESRALIETHRRLMDEAWRQGVFRGAEPLEPTAVATSVRHEGGKVLISDGPFAETKEQLAGYYILDCRDLDEALEWAARIPTHCQGGSGCVEVRPIRAIAQPGAEAGAR